MDTLGTIAELEKNLQQATPEQKPTLLLQMAKMLHPVNSEAAQLYAQQAIDLAKISNQTVIEYKARLHLASIYLRAKDTISALEQARKVYNQLTLHPQEPALHIEALDILCQIALQNKEYHEAEGYREIALNYMMALDDEWLRAKLLRNLGMAYGNSGDLLRAIDLFNTARQITYKLPGQKGLGIIYNDLGYSWQYLGNFKRAKQFYTKALALFENDLPNLANTMLNLGLTQLELNDYLNALNSLHRAAELFDRLSDRDHQTMVIMGMIRALYETGKIDEAQDMLATVKQNTKLNWNAHTEAELYLYLCYLAPEQQQEMLLKEKLPQALDWATANKEHSLQARIYQFLALVARNNNDWEQYDQYLRLKYESNTTLEVEAQKLETEYYKRQVMAEVSKPSQPVAAVETNQTQVIQTRRLLEMVLNNVPVQVYWKDTELHYLGCNNLFSEAAGLESPEQIVGQTAQTVWGEDKAHIYEVDEYKVLRDGKPIINGIMQENYPDGSPAWYEYSIVPLVNSAGTTIGVLGTYGDITDKTLARKNLMDNEDKYRTLFESSPDAIVVVDDTGKLLDCNDRACHLFGYDNTQELLELRIEQIIDLSMANDDRASSRLKNLLERAIKQGQAKSEWQAFKKDESEFTAEIWLTAFKANQEDRLQANIRDITNQVEQREQLAVTLQNMEWANWELNEINDKLGEEIACREQIEQDLIKAKQDAETANRSKSEFLWNISHEIRTPINCIIGFSELILQSESTGFIHSRAKTILTESDILLMLINDLLDHAKLEAGKIVLDYKPVSIAHLLKSVYNVLNVKAQAKGLEFIQDIAPDVPGYIFGDDLRLRQILMNLCANAIKFTDKGHLAINVRHVSSSENTAVVRFEVADTGIGIKQENLDKIFVQFTQADGSTTRRYGGTGLGTTIARQFVELMEGRIGVYSQVGKGSIFWFEIPFDLATKGDFEQDAENYVETETTLSPSNDDKQYKILLAEDYPPNQEVARMHLLSMGWQVDVAANGAEAVEALKQQSYNLVLMDIQMPIMDGYEAVAAIRQLTNGNQNVTIVGLTAHADPITRGRCLEATMRDTITKPIRRDSFLRKVKKWLEFDPDSDEFIDFEQEEEPAIDKPMYIDKTLIIDYNRVLKEFYDDKELLDSVIEQFSDLLPEQLEQITTAVQTKDFETLYAQSHKIKGGAANLCAHPLSESASSLETAARNKDLDQATMLLPAFTEKVQTFLQHCANLSKPQ